MGWAAGFNAGTNMARGWLDAYHFAQQQVAGQEMAKLGDQAQVTQGQGLQITAPDGTTSTAVIDPNSGGDINAITKAYTDQGYKVSPLQSPQFVSRAGSLDTSVATGSQADALNNAGMYNVDHLNQMANIYAKYGEPDKAAALTAQASQLQRQNVSDYHTNLEFQQKQGLQDAIAAAGNDPEKIQAAYIKAGQPLQAAQYGLYNSQGRTAAVEAKRQEQIQGVIDQSHDWLTRLDGSKDDQMGVYGEMADMYNKDHRYQDGVTASVHTGADGKPILVRADASGKVLGADALTPALARNYVMQHQRFALSMLDPKYDLQKQTIDNEQAYRTSALSESHRHNVATEGLEGQRVGLERARNNVLANAYGRPNYLVDGATGGYVGVGYDRRSGSQTVTPVLAPDGHQIMAPASKGLDPQVWRYANEQADAAVAADKTLKNASPERRVAARNAALQQYLGPFGGAVGNARPAGGLNLNAAAASIQSDSKAPAAAPAPAPSAMQPPLTAIDKITRGHELLGQIDQLSRIYNSLGPNDPNRAGVQQALNQLSQQYADVAR